MKIILDYIWLDGQTFSDIRYITKIIDADVKKYAGVASYLGTTPRLLTIDNDEDKKIPPIIVDGTRTEQESENGLTLIPKRLFINPYRENSYYVICEPYDGDLPHTTNSRYTLSILNDNDKQISFEQNILLYKPESILMPFRQQNDSNLTSVYKSKNANDYNADLFINDFIDHVSKLNLPVEEIKLHKKNHWVISTTKEKDILLLADYILLIRHIMYGLSKKYGYKITFDNLYFIEVVPDKDKINDPYLLIKKSIKSLSE